MKTLKICSVIMFVIVVSMQTRGQQAVMYTQYMFNTAALNPAYVATKRYPTIMAAARTQWVGFEGAPKSQTFTLQFPVSEEKIGVGLSIMNDRIGPINETGLFGDFAFQFPVFGEFKMALGIKGGVNFYAAELSKLKVIEPNDPDFAQDIKGRFMPNFAAGSFFYNENFYLGFSIPKILKNSLSLNNTISTSTLGKEERHYYLMSGIVFNLSDNLAIKPSFLAKMVKGSPISFDLNTALIFGQRFWLGATYRFGDAMSAMAEIKIAKNLLVGYSYDYSFTKIMNFNSGTHEIIISYDITAGSRTRLKSPRYF